MFAVLSDETECEISFLASGAKTHTPTRSAFYQGRTNNININFWSGFPADIPDPYARMPRLRLSGPVLRDTARLSQRYPPIARYGVFGVPTWPIGCDTPLPLSVSPWESMRSGGAIPPPQKGYLSDTGAMPYENKANGCDNPLCDTISKRYCAIWGGYLALGR